MRTFWYQKFLDMNNGNFNTKIICTIILIKMSSDIRFSSFLLDSSSNAKKYFKTFLQVIVSIALTDFKIEDFLRDVILFYKQFCLKKATSFMQG